MASYPTTPKTFVTRVTGDVIQAAHVNDLQDEVNAIETGLLQGTARFHSSNSSMATLNVTGKSTFVDGIVVGGNSTFLLHPQIPAEIGLVYRDAIQDFGSSAVSTVIFNAQRFLYDSSMHSTTTGQRLHPVSTGFYRFDAQLAIAGILTSSQYVQIDILDSSNSQVGLDRRDFQSTAIQSLTLQVSGFKRYDTLDGLGAGTSTQYCILRCVTAGGGSTIRASSGNATTLFTITKV